MMEYYHPRECAEHKTLEIKVSNLENQVDVIHSDLKAIKYLLVAVVGSILGTEVIL